MSFRGVEWYRDTARLLDGFIPYMRQCGLSDDEMVEDADIAAQRAAKEIQELCDYIEELMRANEAYRKLAVALERGLP